MQEHIWRKGITKLKGDVKKKSNANMVWISHFRKSPTREILERRNVREPNNFVKKSKARKKNNSHANVVFINY